jgi:hydroxymethylbilane synthase
MTGNRKLRIGARSSELSRRQAARVVELLSSPYPDLHCEIKLVTTTGDRRLDQPLTEIGGKGLFTEELEIAMLAGRIDLAVHSLKDLPVQGRDGLVIGAILERADVSDALVSRSGLGLGALPDAPVIGTSSHRRAAQLLHVRPDLQPMSIRGNVETRLRKALDPAGPLDAIVVATAGLQRLGLVETVTEVLALDLMLPAPGQGALAVQCRDDATMRDLLSLINDRRRSWPRPPNGHSWPVSAAAARRPSPPTASSMATRSTCAGGY